jgi:hypothetical protein
MAVLVSLLTYSSAQADEWTLALEAFEADDYVRAIQLMTPLADSGDVRAQSKLRHMYAYGEGAPVDEERLAHYARLAAEQGDCDSMRSMVLVYTRGEGVVQDFGKSAEWAQRAYDKGCRGAAYLLGLLYQEGNGLPKDEARAQQLFQEGAEAGDVEAQLRLGVVLTSSSSSLEDRLEGIDWLRKAANQRHTLASLMLGVRSAYGSAKEIPLVEATLHAQIAMDAKCKDAVLIFSSLYARMSQQQKDQLLRDRKTFHATHPPRAKHDHLNLGEICETQ